MSMASPLPEVFVLNVSDESYEYEYKISQEEEEEEIDIDEEEEEQVEEEEEAAQGKQFLVVITGKYMVKRLPEIYTGPMETLAFGRQVLSIDLQHDQDLSSERLDYEDFSSVMSERLIQTLRLPRQQCPALISKFLDAARCFSSLSPEISGELVKIPIKFSVRVVTVQKKGEDLEATLARAVRPSPDSESQYEDYVEERRLQRLRREDRRDEPRMDLSVESRWFDIVTEMEKRGEVLSKEEKLRLYKHLQAEAKAEAEAEEEEGGGAAAF